MDDRMQAGPGGDANEVEDLLDAALAQLGAMQLSPLEVTVAEGPGLDAGVQADIAPEPSAGVDVDP